MRLIFLGYVVNTILSFLLFIIKETKTIDFPKYNKYVKILIVISALFPFMFIVSIIGIWLHMFIKFIFEKL